MSSKASAIRATIQIKRYSSQTPGFHKCLNFLSAPILFLEARETLLQCGHRIVGELNCTSLASCEHHTEPSGGSALVSNAGAPIAAALAFLLVFGCPCVREQG